MADELVSALGAALQAVIGGDEDTGHPALTFAFDRVPAAERTGRRDCRGFGIRGMMCTIGPRASSTAIDAWSFFVWVRHG